MSEISGSDPLLEAITASHRITVTGLAGSAPAYLIARLVRLTSKPLFVAVTPTTKEMEQVARELEFFLAGASDGEGPAVYSFPPYDSLPYFRISPHRDIQAQRMQTLAALLFDPRPKVLLTSAAGLASPVLAPDILRTKRQIFKKGGVIDRTILVSLLLDWGYQQSPLVEDRGGFAVRGGIIDLWGPLDALPWRIELFGDEIESIRRFDPQSQKSQEFLDEVWLIPVRELLWDDASRNTLARRYVEQADAAGLKATEKREIAEKIRQGIFVNGIEHLLSLLSSDPISLTDYLPDSMHLILIKRHEIESHLEELLAELTDTHARSDSFERVLLPPTLLYRSILTNPSLASQQTLEIAELAINTGPHQAVATEANHDLRQLMSNRRDSPIDLLVKKLKGWFAENRLIIVASSTAQQRRLLDLLSPHSLPLVGLSETFQNVLATKEHQAILVVGNLSRGFRWPRQHLIVITDEEIFGPKARRRETKITSRGRSPVTSKLKEGDPIVHEEHGIGLYRGLIHLEIDGTENEFLLLEYASQDRLYLPIYRMNQIEPYTGGPKAPRLDRLGGNRWQKVRQKVQRAIRQLAGELLNLYAARAAGHGYPFPPGGELFEAFEASFPYEETEDQERTIHEVLIDMERALPMDRLVLGDVGYGKTEVAMRAAFKSVLAGKQVAVLVPTTVLAFQHFQNFQERFRDYPIQIGMLSRFQSPKEMKATLQNIKQGTVDIVIGTHRLLQPDVAFKDLGLLVIDEEHRFGVSQKEKIKKFKKMIDVLALSATPIPRSLNMALTGIREISVIETPPTDRLAIRTYVAPYSDATVQEVVMREIKRGGQVFYVHNRVQNIEKTAARLANLLPDIRIAIAHGQMPEARLEKVMIDFTSREYDLLLCTTIIESGIDIPTANTILIERADLFGLAQIYQLRGRVGRGRERAYAYLLIPNLESLTEDAKKRLAVLQRFSELGSGFKMASYDLEIRGAGNILGEKQWGHMEAIGYELYAELLERAIRELKGEEVLEAIEPELELKVAAYLPDDYIPDPEVRLDLYRRLASLGSVEESYTLEEEIVDRFGKAPIETENLLRLMAVKVLAKRLRLRAIRYGNERFIYHFDASTPLPPEKILSQIGHQPDRYRLTPEMKLIIQQRALSEQERLSASRDFLQSLAEAI